MFLGPLLALLTACSDDGATTSASTGSTGTSTTSSTSPTTDPGTTDDPTGTTGVIDPTTSPTTTGNTTSQTSTTDVITTGDTTSLTSQTDTTDASTTGDTTDSTTTDNTTGATSPLTIAIVDAYLYAECGGVGDPVQGTWYVEFDNTANPAPTSAVVQSASLSLHDADPPVLEPITVAPLASGPLAAGEYVSQEMMKLPGLTHSACEHCGEFYLLVLEYDEGGVTHIVDEEVTIQCGR